MSRIETCPACFEYGVACPWHRSFRSEVSREVAIQALDSAVLELEESVRRLKERVEAVRSDVCEEKV